MSSRYAPPGYFPVPGGHSFPYQLAGASELSMLVPGWDIRSVGVTNPNAFFVSFPNQLDGGWVTPYSFGAVVAINQGGGGAVIASSKLAPGGYPSSPASSGLAYLTAFEDALPPSPGVASPPQARAAAFPSLSRAPGTYSFDVPFQFNVKGIVVYSFVSAGAGTVVFAIQIADVALAVISNSYVTSAAIAAGSANILRMYPGLTPAAGFDANGICGQTPRITAVVGGGSAVFASDYDLIT